MSTGAQLTTPQQLAALLRARTKDDQGREVGLWNESTRPTLGQVEQLIEAARRAVGRGRESATCEPAREAAVALHAAMLVELSYYPEQVASGRSPYAQMLALYQQTLEGYELCLESAPDIPGAGGVYSVRTPSLPLGRVLPKQVVNWNDPHSEDIDDPPNPPWWQELQPQ